MMHYVSKKKIPPTVGVYVLTFRENSLNVT